MARKIIKTSKKEKSEQPKILSEDDLLAVAQGSKEPTSVGLKSNKYWIDNSATRKEFIRFRREIRRGIYSILKCFKFGWNYKDDPKLAELYEIINAQLDPNRGLDWSAFTHKWDIHPKLGLQVIIKEHWVKEGGGFDTEIGTHYPHAFTKQVID